jgi:hypothetical protein
MLNRRVTRTILNSTETTANLGNPNSTAYAFDLEATDAFYIGFHGPFASRYIQIGAVNANNSVMSVEYWNGSAWTAVDDFIDQTSISGKTLAQSGFISWVNATDWAKKSLTGIDSDVELYWVKITVSEDLSALCTLKGVLNLFSDDTLLRSYYPELITDANYLPSYSSNFLDQHLAAKNLVVLRLKQRKLIDEESQVIDINSVAIAAVHACAWLILNPIAMSDQSRDLANRALAQFNNEIERLSLDVDRDKDGVVSTSERHDISETWVQRR